MDLTKAKIPLLVALAGAGILVALGGWARSVELRLLNVEAEVVEQQVVQQAVNREQLETNRETREALLDIIYAMKGRGFKFDRPKSP